MAKELIGNIKGPAGVSDVGVVANVTGTEARPSHVLTIWVGGETKPQHMGLGDFWFTPETLVGPEVPNTDVAPTITTGSILPITVGSLVNQILSATGTAPIVWSTLSGTMPAGLVLGANGVISGTPTTAGTSSFTVQAANTAGSITKQYTVDVAAPASIYSTVYGDVPPSMELTTMTDAGPNDWLGQQFYVAASPHQQLYVHGVRLYVPSGSSMIGQTGKIGISRRDNPPGIFMSQDSPSGPSTNGSSTNMSQALVAGWNEFLLSSSYSFASLEGLIAAYNVGGSYLFSPTIQASSVLSSGALKFYMAEETIRSFYGVDPLARTQSQGYGIDIMVSDVP